MNSTDSDNFYCILGVSEHADLPEIKAAFNRKIKELHPDKAKDSKCQDPELVIKTIEAWTVLKNQDRRKEYDEAIRKGRIKTGYSSHKYTWKINWDDAEILQDSISLHCEQCGDQITIQYSDLNDFQVFECQTCGLRIEL